MEWFAKNIGRITETCSKGGLEPKLMVEGIHKQVSQRMFWQEKVNTVPVSYNLNNIIRDEEV